MAWSEAARAAALQARRMHIRANLYNPVPAGHGSHVSRKEMAKAIRDVRNSVAGARGPGRSASVVRQVVTNQRTGKRGLFTNVKGAHFVDQGTKGRVWRSASEARRRGMRAPWAGVPKWSASVVSYGK